MNDPRETGSGSGWTVLKVLGVIVGLMGLVGFGVCSLCGFSIGGRDTGIFVLASIGAVIAALFGWMAVAIIRSTIRGRKREP